MIQAKEFKGNSTVYGGGRTCDLDDKINEWLKSNTYIKIISCQYSTADKDNSSVLILY